VVLLSEGNLRALRPATDTSLHRPVTDLAPAELAVIWRTGDRRTAVRVVADTCFACANRRCDGFVTGCGIIGQ